MKTNNRQLPSIDASTLNTVSGGVDRAGGKVDRPLPLMGPGNPHGRVLSTSDIKPSPGLF